MRGWGSEEVGRQKVWCRFATTSPEIGLSTSPSASVEMTAGEVLVFFGE